MQLKNEKTAGQIFEMTFRLQIVKQEDGSSVGLLKIKHWMLWRGSISPKQKKRTTQRGGVSNVEASASQTPLSQVTDRTLQGVAQDECTRGSGGSGWRVITVTLNKYKRKNEEYQAREREKNIASTTLGRKGTVIHHVTKCLKAGIEESLPRQRTEAFPLQ
jgi:hypothetical protein